jgi:hypothetical protein
VETVKRPDEQRGLIILPRRWLVERTFAWFGRYRRLSKGYEYLPKDSEAINGKLSSPLLPISCVAGVLDRATSGTRMRCCSPSTANAPIPGGSWSKWGIPWIFPCNVGTTKKPAKKFFRKLLKGCTCAPRAIVTDKVGSHGAAKRQILLGVELRQYRYLNNRADNSHQPMRQRERWIFPFVHRGAHVCQAKCVTLRNPSATGGHPSLPFSPVLQTAPGGANQRLPRSCKLLTRTERSKELPAPLWTDRQRKFPPVRLGTTQAVYGHSLSAILLPSRLSRRTMLPH